MKSTHPSFLSARSALLLSAGAAALVATSVLVTLRVAGADQGGATTATLSFAGTLRQNGQPMTGTQQVTFSFKKAGAVVCAPVVSVAPDSASGDFVASIPLGACPATLFDGADVLIDVKVGTTLVAAGQPISAVPYAKYADQVALDLDCPSGYDRDTTPGIIVCKRGDDELVKVGEGASSFWVDRFEASAWDSFDAPATQYGTTSDDYPVTFADTGGWATQVYALSRRGVSPSRYVTWFQALEACHASGKRLPLKSEWLTAARGTVDPGSHDGTGGACRTAGTAPRSTGDGTQCRSAWGAEDMVGGIWEWTDEWYAGLGAGTPTAQPWPTAGVTGSYGGDGTFNITSSAQNGGSGNTVGLPAAALRGGAWDNGTAAGIFALDLREGPSYAETRVGFRCVRTAR